MTSKIADIVKFSIVSDRGRYKRCSYSAVLFAPTANCLYLPGYLSSQFGSLAEGNDIKIIGQSDSAASSTVIDMYSRKCLSKSSLQIQVPKKY